MTTDNYKERFNSAILRIIINLEFAYVVRTVGVILFQLYKKEN